MALRPPFVVLPARVVARAPEGEDLGFGRIIPLEAEAPNTLVNLA